MHAVLLSNDFWWKKPPSPGLTSNNQTISLRLSHPPAQKEALSQTGQSDSELPEQPETASPLPQPKEPPQKPLTTQLPAPTPHPEKAVEQVKAVQQRASTETASPATESSEISTPDTDSSQQSGQTSDFEQWLARLQTAINQNKTYPWQARRRHLSGSVEVVLKVNPDGSLIKAEIIRGRKAFHNSTLTAIRNAFPTSQTHKDRPVSVHLTVHYHLR